MACHLEHGQSRYVSGGVCCSAGATEILQVELDMARVWKEWWVNSVHLGGFAP